MTGAWPCEHVANGSGSRSGKKTVVGRDSYIKRNRKRERES